MFNKHTLSALPLILLTASQSCFAAAPTEAELLAQCDLNKNGKVEYKVRDPSQVSQAERANILKEAVCGHRLKMAALVKEIPDLIAQCDTNGNGEIDNYSRYGVISQSEFKALKPELRELVGREQTCAMDKEGARLDAELAKGKEELAKLDAELAKLDADSKRFDQIIAMLPKEDAKRALNLEQTKTEQQLRSTTTPEQREKLQIRLRIIQEQLAKLK